MAGRDWLGGWHEDFTIIEARLEQLAEQGIEPEKPPYRVGGKPDGTLICFVRDPDDYRIELIQR